MRPTNKGYRARLVFLIAVANTCRVAYKARIRAMSKSRAVPPPEATFPTKDSSVYGIQTCPEWVTSCPKPEATPSLKKVCLNALQEKRAESARNRGLQHSMGPDWNGQSEPGQSVTSTYLSRNGTAYSIVGRHQSFLPHGKCSIYSDNVCIYKGSLRFRDIELRLKEPKV